MTKNYGKGKGRILFAAALAVTLALTTAVYAEPPAMPSGEGSGNTPSNNGGAPSGNVPGGNNTSSSSVTHTGATTLKEDTTAENASYSSANSAENALLVESGTISLTNPTVNKTGDADGDEADFYGTNAAVFTSGGTLNLTGGTVTANGAHANGVFAYGSGIINITDAVVKTSSNNSGGIMVTGGGTLTAKNLTVTTDGNSSAPIRSDRGGGTITVEGGTYTSNGTGSPVIYSTADITAKNASLTATKSEGVVIEGKNSVTLEGVTLTDNNTTLNGNSETYKNVFIYQSMSGDADEGTGSFTAKNSTFKTENGDTFFITNTIATIDLKNNTFENSSGAFLRAQSGKWGTSGKNGGVVMLSTVEQEIVGDIVLDDLSTLSADFRKDSFVKGAFNSANSAESISFYLSKDSVIVLTADSYLTSLTNEDSENANIYSSGHKLYVDGKEVSTNSATAPTGRKNAAKETVAETEATASETKITYNTGDSTLSIIIWTVVSLLLLGIAGGVMIVMKRSLTTPSAPIAPPEPIIPENPAAPETQTGDQTAVQPDNQETAEEAPQGANQ